MINFFVSAHYESVMMYAEEINEMITNETQDLSTAGDVVVSRILGSEYNGLAGPMRIGMDGERDSDLELRTFNAKSGVFEVPKSLYSRVELTKFSPAVVKPA